MAEYIKTSKFVNVLSGKAKLNVLWTITKASNQQSKKYIMKCVHNIILNMNRNIGKKS